MTEKVTIKDCVLFSETLNKDQLEALKLASSFPINTDKEQLKPIQGIDNVAYETALEKLRNKRKEVLLFSDDQLSSVENSEKSYIKSKLHSKTYGFRSVRSFFNKKA